MFTKGRTATECGGGLNAAAAAGASAAGCVAVAVGGVGGRERLESKNLSTAMAANTTAITAPATHSPALERRGWRTDVGDIGTLVEPASVGPRSGEESGDNKRRTRSTNADVVSPPGKRVHCTCLKGSGTRALLSLVPSMARGTTNALSSAMSPARSTANLHSRRK